MGCPPVFPARQKVRIVLSILAGSPPRMRPEVHGLRAEYRDLEAVVPRRRMTAYFIKCERVQHVAQTCTGTGAIEAVRTATVYSSPHSGRSGMSTSTAITSR